MNKSTDINRFQQGKTLKGSHPIPLFGRLLLALAVFMEPSGSGLLMAAAETSTAAPAASVSNLKNISYENRVLRIELDKAAAYRVFTLSAPPRLVVELSQTAHSDRPYEARVDDGTLKRIRSAQFQTTPEKVTRVVLDMPRMVSYDATQNGNEILLRFSESTPAAATDASSNKLDEAHGSPIQRTLSGEASAQTASAAAEKPAPKAASKKVRDLLASLPKNSVTIDFDEADVRDVIRVLSEMSGINIIHASDIRGFVSIHLDQVPFDEAFNTILAMQGLVAQQMGENVLRILTPEALNADRARSVVTYKTFTLNYARATEVVTHLSAVRISPNAKASVDERTNAIIVTDTPEGLAAAERLIAELDKKPLQVMIEAKMVEVILSDNLDIGIRWEYSNINQDNKGPQILGIRETKAGTEAPAGAIGFVGTRNNPLTGTLEETVTRSAGPLERGTGLALPGSRQEAAISFGFINNTDLLTATLNALAQRGQTKILSSPKVVTVNNQAARIQVGSKIPFSVTNVTGTGVVTQSFQFVDVGILLSVTPTINADNRIRVKVKPEVSFPGSVGPAGPEINTRNAETEVIIRDGETLVIGGLIDEQMRETAQKVPLLGDIPVLGVFFRSTSDSKRRNELLVFVTPRIVRD
ncbi:MAG: type IV pilus secretin PilQ [Elusimicrobia bacterium]|nr:type IV pilus secretin PilQ [Elusimicrobiota bacterium]